MAPTYPEGFARLENGRGLVQAQRARERRRFRVVEDQPPRVHEGEVRVARRCEHDGRAVAGEGWGWQQATGRVGAAVPAGAAEGRGSVARRAVDGT